MSRSGVVLLALQQTLFADLRPAGVMVQVVLALAAAAGAGGGPQKGALAGFVLGLMYDLRVGYAARVVVDRDGPRRLHRRLRRRRSRSTRTWWLAAMFTALGAAVGEAVVPRRAGVHRRGGRASYRLIVIVGVVACGGVPDEPDRWCPIGRWCMRVKRTDRTSRKQPSNEQPMGAGMTVRSACTIGCV